MEREKMSKQKLGSVKELSNSATLAGKVALITGAARGIGVESARQLGQLGAVVVVAARDPIKAEATAKTMRSERIEAEFIKLDISAEDDRQAAYAYLSGRHGKLDILINNAAVWLESEDAATAIPNRTSSLSLEVLPLPQPQLKAEAEDFSDLTHGHSPGWHAVAPLSSLRRTACLL